MSDAKVTITPINNRAAWAREQTEFDLGPYSKPEPKNCTPPPIAGITEFQVVVTHSAKPRSYAERETMRKAVEQILNQHGFRCEVNTRSHD